MPDLSSGQLVVLLVMAVIFAALGYWLSEVDRRRFGRTPWGLPSGVWALFWFLSMLLGLVLYLIAHADVVRRARQLPGGRFPEARPYAAGSDAVVSQAAPSAADVFPAYPRPANGGMAARGGHSEGMSPGPAAEAPANSAGTATGTGGGWTSAEGDTAAPAGGPPTVSPPAWHPDPSGRFHYRWWDGSQWTSYVSVNGQQLIDTSPDQRIGPY